MWPVVLQQQLLLLLLFPLDCNTDINQNREAAVGENRDLISLIQCISLAADTFWHWSHSHWNCIFLLLWKSTAFLPLRSYLLSFHNRNLIKSQTKQPLRASKNPNCQWWNRPKQWWTWSDERWAQNRTLHPNNPQMAWIIIIYIHAIFDTHEQMGKKSCLLHATIQCALGHSLKSMWAVFILLRWKTG